MSSSMASSSSIASNPSLYDMLDMFSEKERLKPEESWYVPMDIVRDLH